MKIIINYDLIKKVQIAKTNFGLKRIAMKYDQSILYYSGIIFTNKLIHHYSISQALGETLLMSIIALSVWSIPEVGAYMICGDVIQENAINDLRILSLELTNQGICTSDILLLESVQNGRAIYKGGLNEEKIPYVMQEKYILIPTYDDGKEDVTELLQEHRVFPPSDEYVLTIGSRARKKVLKPAYSSGLI